MIMSSLREGKGERWGPQRVGTHHNYTVSSWYSVAIYTSAQSIWVAITSAERGARGGGFARPPPLSESK